MSGGAGKYTASIGFACEENNAWQTYTNGQPYWVPYYQAYTVQDDKGDKAMRIARRLLEGGYISREADPDRAMCEFFDIYELIRGEL